MMTYALFRAGKPPRYDVLITWFNNRFSREILAISNIERWLSLRSRNPPSGNLQV